MISDRKISLQGEYENICASIPEFRKYRMHEFWWARLAVITRIFGFEVGHCGSSEKRQLFYCCGALIPSPVAAARILCNSAYGVLLLGWFSQDRRTGGHG